DPARYVLGLCIVHRREQHPELIAAGACAAGAFGGALSKRVRNSEEQAVAGGVTVKVVDPLEMIEVEKQKHARGFRLQHLRQRTHQFTTVRKSGPWVRVGVSLRNPLGGLIRVERLLEVLRPAPAKQNDRDVEKE